MSTGRNGRDRRSIKEMKQKRATAITRVTDNRLPHSLDTLIPSVFLHQRVAEKELTRQPINDEAEKIFDNCSSPRIEPTRVAIRNTSSVDDVLLYHLIPILSG